MSKNKIYQCVSCGFCCSANPCPYGEIISIDNTTCKFLTNENKCGKYNELKDTFMYFGGCVHPEAEHIRKEIGYYAHIDDMFIRFNLDGEVEKKFSESIADEMELAHERAMDKMYNAISNPKNGEGIAEVQNRHKERVSRILDNYEITLKGGVLKRNA